MKFFSRKPKPEDSTGDEVVQYELDGTTTPDDEAHKGIADGTFQLVGEVYPEQDQQQADGGSNSEQTGDPVSGDGGAA